MDKVPLGWLHALQVSDIHREIYLVHGPGVFNRIAIHLVK
jgi:hypothetical protein